jgi:hypothetical protein
MQLLVSGAMPTVEKLAQLGTAHLGAFWTPATGNSLDRMEGWGLPYGIDNGCFVLRSDNSPANRRKVLDGFMRYVWVKHWERKAGPVFVAVPDVVGSHAGTLRSFCGWWPMLSPLDLPLAFVAQNGATPANIPWDLFPPSSWAAPPTTKATNGRSAQPPPPSCTRRSGGANGSTSAG